MLFYSRSPEWISLWWNLGFSHSSIGKVSACNAGDPRPARSPGEGICYPLLYSWVSLVAQLVKNLPAMWETWVQCLVSEDPLEKGVGSLFILQGIFPTRDQTHVSRIAGGFFTTEPLSKPLSRLQRCNVTYLSKINTHFRVCLSSGQRTWNNKK